MIDCSTALTFHRIRSEFSISTLLCHSAYMTDWSRSFADEPQFPSDESIGLLIECRRLQDDIHEARDNLIKAKADQAFHANKHRSPEPGFKIGDKVWLNTANRRRDYLAGDSSRTGTGVVGRPNWTQNSMYLLQEDFEGPCCLRHPGTWMIGIFNLFVILSPRSLNNDLQRTRAGR